MYTKNPVSGKNETLVNTSMLKGAIDGVTSKIAGKADKRALESLSLYTEHVADSVAAKADESEVQSLSKYVEGRLPKSVYDTMVDAYVGLACKVADPDVLEGAAKMAFAADPVKYATSNPSDNGCVELTRDVYVEGNPIYDAVTTAASTGIIELPPLLRLQSTSDSLYDVGETPTTWKTELPNLTDGTYAFDHCTGLTTWDVELPNLTNGYRMFSLSGLTTWNVELLNLINGQQMFYKCTGLTSFTVALPAIHTAAEMFFQCQLDIDSLRCIAEGINDVSNLSVGDHSITIGLSSEAFNHPDKQKHVDLLHSKGWYNVVIS